MKYRISDRITSRQSGPPEWECQDNIVLIPKDIVALPRKSSARSAGAGPDRAPRRGEA